MNTTSKKLESMRWSIEPAADGVGVWLVGRDEHDAEVIAAPGSTTGWAERHLWPTEREIAGWRWARWEWEGSDRPNLDRDPPSAGTGTSATSEVLRTVDVCLHDAVREILEEQLARLEAIDLLPALTQDPGFEPAAHADLAALAALRMDLAEAFPQTHGYLENAAELLRTRHRSLPGASDQIPRTVAELEQRLIAPLYTQGLGGRELLRLLKRRMIWRILERAPRPLSIALLACSDPRSETHELADRYLRDRSVCARWPATTPSVSGIAGRVRTIVVLSRLPAQDDSSEPPIAMVGPSDLRH
jgi:hypothetical protein